MYTAVIAAPQNCCSPNAAGKAHWEVLLRARAIETQCYVIAAAQVSCRTVVLPALFLQRPIHAQLKHVCSISALPILLPSLPQPPPQLPHFSQAGRHNEKRESYGHSLVVDPWGVVVGRLEDPLATGIAVADIDLAQLAGIRERMPVQEHRRLGRPAVLAGGSSSGSGEGGGGEGGGSAAGRG